MVAFGDMLKTVKDGPDEKLEQPALEVSKACQSLITSWWDAGAANNPLAKWLAPI